MPGPHKLEEWMKCCAMALEMLSAKAFYENRQMGEMYAHLAHAA